MTESVNVIAQARGMRQALGIDSNQLIDCSALIKTALAHQGLTIERFDTASSDHPDLAAVLKAAETAIRIDSSLLPSGGSLAAALVLTARFIQPDNIEWKARQKSLSRYGISSRDEILRVDVSTQQERLDEQIFELAAEFLLPGKTIAEKFNNDHLTAQEIAASLNAPIQLVHHQLLKYALVPIDALSESEAEQSPKDFSLEALDPSQRAAASASPGPILVGAGPGTGKTRTLVARAVHLVRDLRVKPSGILALTYSRAAAAQMQAQIAEGLSGLGVKGKPWVGTLHSFGMDLVRSYYSELGFDKEPQLLDTLDAVNLIESNLDDCCLDILLSLYDPAPNLVNILGRVSRAKDELCTPDEYLKLAERMAADASNAVRAIDERLRDGEKIKKTDIGLVKDAHEKAQKCVEIAHCYAAYESLKRRRNLVDYGDLITLPVQLLETNPKIAQEIGNRFPHILADEYQDVNRASAKLLKLLASSKNGEGLWVVGDHRQSIYRFRGSSPVNIKNFRDDYPHGRHLELEVNYRSVKPIVDCFSHFAIDGGLHVLPGEDETARPHAWQSFRGDIEVKAIEQFEADSLESQNAGIANLVIAELQAGKKPSDIAILCRTNTQVEQVAEALETANISTLVIGDPFVRPEVQDILALFAFGSGELLPALYRIVQMPYFSDCAEIVGKVSELVGSPISIETDDEPAIATSTPTQTDSVLEILAKVNHPEARKLEELYSQLSAHQNSPQSMLAAIVFELLPVLERSSDQYTVFSLQMALAVKHLFGLAQEYEAKGSNESAFYINRSYAFITHLKRMIGLGLAPRITAPHEANSETVRVMTIHAAKGLEFPITILPYLSKSGFHGRGSGDGLADPVGMVDEADDIPEDKFLFFVALSRAKDKLILTRSLTKNGKDEAISPLYEIIEPWLAEQGFAAQHWSDQRQSAAEIVIDTLPFTPTLTGRAPVFHESALAAYMRCPRQYFYQYVEKLSAGTQKSPYQKLHRVVWNVIGWMQKSWASGETAGLSDMQDYLEEQWPESGLVGVQNEELYKFRAQRMVTNAFENRSPGRIVEDIRFEAELAGARVKISPDAIFESEDELSFTLVRYKTGRRSSDDHTDKRLALMRRAAESSGKAANIQLQYLMSGDVIDVPSTRYEPDRVKKYIDAVQGIQDKKFDPAPNRECRTCAFMLICDRKEEQE